MGLYPDGKFVHGELSTADASTAAVVTLYDDTGATHTLTVGERLIVDSYEIVAAAAAVFELFIDKDDDGVVDAGELVAHGALAANGVLANSSVEHAGSVVAAADKSRLKLKASGAAAVRVLVRGRVIRG